MSSAPSAPVLPFAELLDELRRHGFVIGLDQHLRLQRLLDHLAGECPPERLKTHLAPIFATSREEQERFHRIFDRIYPVFAEVEREEQERHSGHTGESAVPLGPPKGPDRRWWIIGSGMFLIVLLFIGLWQWLGPGPSSPEPIEQVTVTPAPTPLPTPGVDSLASLDSVNTLRALPDPDTLPPVRDRISSQGFLDRHRTGLRFILIVLAIAGFLLNEWRLYQRRRLVVSRERRQKPPFTWPVRLESPANPFAQSAELPNAARLLRQREAGDVARLSVEETVTATIAARGFPTFRYRTDTRAPDYLLLIERAAYRDHAARLYQALARSLEREGVHVTRYLHDGDPRVCYSENGEQRELLVDLRRRFPDYRVLLFSKGEKLVDQVTGRLHSWTTQFLSWSDRAILTPESPAAWGLREVALAQHFVVLPATTAGLMGVVGHFRGPARPDPARWRALDQDPAAPRLDDGDPLPGLQSYLGPRVYRWLCACAVYPELHWDLTLHFGTLTILGPGLISEENLLRLLRLPWFRQGAIPDEIRARLIDELTEAEERAVREAIVELLERNPAPGDSVSANRYELDLVVQRLALHRRDPKQRRAAMRDLAGFPRSELVQDFAMLKLIEETPSSRLQVLLPRRLRRVFYRGGVPVLGVRSGIRAAALVGVIGATVFLTRPALVESPPETLIVLRGSESGHTLVVGEQTEMMMFHRMKDGLTPNDYEFGPVPGESTEWSVDRPDILSVDRLGDVTALKPGEAVISVVSGGAKSRLKVTVAPADLAINRDSVDLRPGDVRALKLLVPSQDRELITRGYDGVSWSVSDSMLVRVAADGVIEALRPGRATVTVNAIGRTASVAVTIGGPPVNDREVATDPRRAIDQVLLEYIRAAEAGDIDRMVALYPSMPRAVRAGYDRLGAARGGIRAKDWKVEVATIFRDSARLKLSGSLDLFDGERRVIRKAQIEGMTLVRRDDNWVIADIATAADSLALPPRALAYYSQASLLYQQGKLDRAREFAERALAAYPVYTEAEVLLEKLKSGEEGTSTGTNSSALLRLDSLRLAAERGGPAESKRYFAAFDSILLKPTQRAMLDQLDALSADNRRITFSSASALLRTYLATTVYPGKAQPDLIGPVLFNVWRDTSNAPNSAESRIALRQFVTYARQLPKGGAPTGVVDSAAVRRARALLARLYDSDRDELYSALLAEAGQAPGARSILLFPQTGDRPALLTAPSVASQFTRAAWAPMQQAISEQARSAADSESWLLGSEPSERQKYALAERLGERYRTEYAGRWKSVMAGAQFARYEGLTDASLKLFGLAGRSSQLVQLLATVGVNTSVDSALARQFGAAIAFAPPDSAKRLSKQAQSYTATLAGLAVTLEQLRDPSRTSGNIGDRVRGRMNDAREAASAAVQPYLDDPVSRDVGRLVLRLLLDPIERVEPLLSGGDPQQPNAAAAAFCGTLEPVLAMRPFSRGGKSATLDQVNAVFHPSTGSLWRLLGDQMSPYLIRAGTTFVAKPGSTVTLNPRFVSQINRAVAFSQALYPPGQLGPRLSFALRPLATENSVVTLSVGERKGTFSRDRAGDQTFEWVGIEGKDASLAVSNGAEVKTMVRTGTWAVFDLFAETKGWKSLGGRTRGEWEYQSNGRTVTQPFEISFGGAPVLDPEWLSGLTCERQATVR